MTNIKQNIYNHGQMCINRFQEISMSIAKLGSSALISYLCEIYTVHWYQFTDHR